MFRKSQDSGLNLKFAIASLESLPPAVARVYTDASYFEDKDGNYHCGNAAVLVNRNKCYKKQQRYHLSLMIYNAEQRALISALDLIRENSARLPYGRIHVISDSQSSLSSLAKGYLCQSSRTNSEIFKMISSLNRPISIQFVPSHCGVIGNELADNLAEVSIALIRHKLVKLPGLGLTDCRFCDHTETDAHHLLSKCKGVSQIVRKFFPNLPTDDTEDVGQHHHTFFDTDSRHAEGIGQLLNEFPATRSHTKTETSVAPQQILQSSKVIPE